MISVFFFKTNIKQKQKIFQILINIEAHIDQKFEGQGTTVDDGQNQSNTKEKKKCHILGRICGDGKNVIFTSHGCS